MRKFPLLLVGILLIFGCNPQPSPVSYISPPGIFSPIYNGAEIIGYKDAKAGYNINIYANNSELIGKGTVTPWGYGKIKVNRPLSEGDIITAAQVNNNDNSYQTWLADAVTVQKIPTSRLINGEKFYPPTILEPIYDCQKGYWVKDLIEGVQVTNEISNPSFGISTFATPYQNIFVLCSDLEENQEIRSKQSFPSQTSPNESEYCQAVKVQPKPSTLQDSNFEPIINKDKLVEGVSLIEVLNLITGATVEIFSLNPSSGEKTKIGGGISAGYKTIFQVEPLTSLNIVAEQSLCELKSPSSKPVKPKNSINLPKIKEPICEGAIKVFIRNTLLSADVEVKVKRKGQTVFVPLGSATAPGGTTTIYLGGGVPLKEGDQIIAKQSTTSLSSIWTDPVTVEAYSAECECFPPESYTLTVDLIGQETGLWCWAASGQMIMKFFGKDVTQCEQATKAFGDGLGIECCDETIPSSCIKAYFPLFTEYDFSSMTTWFKGAGDTYLSWDQVKEEIFCKQKPYCSRVYGPHYVVVIGYKTEGGNKYVLINDPFPVSGGSQKWVLYNDHIAQTTSDEYDISYIGN